MEEKKRLEAQAENLQSLCRGVLNFRDPAGDPSEGTLHLFLGVLLRFLFSFDSWFKQSLYQIQSRQECPIFHDHSAEIGYKEM